MTNMPAIRPLIWFVAGLSAVLVSVFVVMTAFPQISEKLIETSCSMTAPDQGCRKRMIAMGHTWAAKGDLDRAREWYARVAAAGAPDAMFHLAWSYQQAGYDDIRQNPGGSSDDPDPIAEPPRRTNFKTAYDWYRKAADRDFAPAMNNLGELAASGLLGEQDLPQAFSWYLAAARAGNPVGAMNVSLAYRIGQGVIADQAEAQRWANFVPAIDSPDLADFTLARTTLHGSTLEAAVRSAIRNAAAEHKALVVGYQPLKPSAGIPTFHKVTRELGETPKNPTLRDLQ